MAQDIVALNNCLLNTEDILTLYGKPKPQALTGPFSTSPKNFLHDLDESIIEKLNVAAPLLYTSQIIPRGQYQNVYITSDVHTDLKKLNYLLNNVGLISANGIVDEDAIALQITDTGSIDWIPNNTLLIIIGDIVDGVRRDINVHTHAITRDQKHPDDKKGNVELLLMAYLYNLRIKARAKNSDIILTVGNHDYQTIITNTLNPTLVNRYDNNGFVYNSYVHKGAQEFFGTRENRRKCLFPFLNTWPYLFINIGDEIMCVHGGFHNTETIELFDILTAAQERINGARSFDGLNQEDHDNLSFSDNFNNDELSPFWTRFYARESPDTVCSTIDASKIPMIVVGHCPTMYDAEHLEYIKNTAEYSSINCKLGGCVLVGCKSPHGPKLAFVDIGMSSCFRRPYGNKDVDAYAEWEREKNIRAEILHLSHDETLSTANRFYNKIYREKVSGIGGNESLLVWSDVVRQNVPGGYRKAKRRTKNYGTRKTNRKSQKRK
jgi:hypothetical protein